MLFSLFFSFLCGALTVVVAEGLVLYLVIRRLSRKNPVAPPVSAVDRDLSIEQQPLTYPFEKQGVIWILEQDVFSKSMQSDSQLKGPKEQKSKQDKIEVSPVRKNAKITGHSLVLMDQSGIQTIIELLECTVEAVSASNSSSKKWMKKFPIRVENKNKIIFNGSKICYLYLETSWEKESWCKALRLASWSKMEKLNWYTQLSDEFNQYRASLSSEYPLFLKPSSTPVDKSNKIDENSSSVRDFFKKFAKKASKLGNEYRSSTVSSSNRGDKKYSDKSLQDALLGNGSLKYSSEKTSLEDLARPSSPTLTLLGSQQVSTTAAVWDEKLSFDEGTLCWNLLFSRLFFDAKRSTEINSLIKTRIQKTLSSMRTPSYIGGITCTGLDLGTLPPYIHNMRALPMDMNEAWAVEVEIEYSGGLVLDIETRLEIHEPEFQKGIVGSTLKPNSSGEVPSDLLEDFANYSHQSNHSINLNAGSGKRDEEDKPDGLGQSRSANWTSTYISRWKTILNSVADHVSQVPISLAIRVASLRGTLRLHVKPPPSDQVWVGFTSTPEIDFNLDSSIGDHKIASSHVALLISNRFKAAIRESLVLPNCECIYIPWMIAEKNDWVPRNAAPFIWIRQESSKVEEKDAFKSQPVESKIKPDSNKGSKIDSVHMIEQTDGETMKSGIHAQQSLESGGLPVSSDSGPDAPATSVSPDQSTSDGTDENLSVPMLRNDEAPEICNQNQVESPERCSISTFSVHEQSSRSLDEDAKARKGRKERMWDLRKKVSQKFDEKRRHIEEKGRHIVEKMRENTKSTSEDDGRGSFKL